jgi:pyruvate,water dikinase
VIGPSRVLRPDRLVYVVPARYGAMGQGARLEVARLIGRINHASEGCKLVVLGPGRWGTRDPCLGLPVNFTEINRVAALCEIVAMNENLVPDVSLGTHFLNELIEADMLYFALFPGKDGNRIDEDFLMGQANRLADILPGQEGHADAVRVIDLPRNRPCCLPMPKTRPWRYSSRAEPDVGRPASCTFPVQSAIVPAPE